MQPGWRSRANRSGVTQPTDGWGRVPYGGHTPTGLARGERRRRGRKRTMRTGHQVRTLAATAMVALAILGAPAARVFAADTGPFNPVKAGCEGAGYTWSDTQGC